MLWNDFESIYLDNYETMWITVCRILKNRADAEDVVHTAFLKLAHAMDCRATPDPDAVKKLCIVIARHEAFNLYHRKKREDAIRKQISIAASEFPEGIPEVLRLMETLKPRYRHILYYHGYLGYSIGELSRLWGIPAPTLYKRLQRARRQLKEKLKD